MRKNICITPYCRKPKAPAKNYCHSCNKRRYAENNPEKYRYQVLRNNAKRRGKEFDLTFEEFRQFCNDTEYMEKRGRTRLSYAIDRINSKLGYTPGNLQALTNSENGAKGYREGIGLPF